MPDPQISLEPPRSVNFSYLTQLLQDTPFASALGRSDDDPTNAELFNGTPPDPVLSNTNLTQDRKFTTFPLTSYPKIQINKYFIIILKPSEIISVQHSSCVER